MGITGHPAITRLFNATSAGLFGEPKQILCSAFRMGQTFTACQQSSGRSHERSLSTRSVPPGRASMPDSAGHSPGELPRPWGLVHRLPDASAALHPVGASRQGAKIYPRHSARSFQNSYAQIQMKTKLTLTFSTILFAVWFVRSQPAQISNNLWNKYTKDSKYLAQAPASDGKPPVVIVPIPPLPTAAPPPLVIVSYPPPLPTNPSSQFQYYMDKYALDQQTVLVPNGKWQVVCQNTYCGATNHIFPVSTNTLILPSMGGRTIERWLYVKCPTCGYNFTNMADQKWIVNVPPVPVLVRTNISAEPVVAPRK